MQSRKSKSVPWYNALTFGQCYAVLRAVAIIMLLVGMLVVGAKAFAHQRHDHSGGLGYPRTFSTHITVLGFSP